MVGWLGWLATLHHFLPDVTLSSWLISWHTNSYYFLYCFTVGWLWCLVGLCAKLLINGAQVHIFDKAFVRALGNSRDSFITLLLTWSFFRTMILKKALISTRLIPLSAFEMGWTERRKRPRLPTSMFPPRRVNDGRLVVAVVVFIVIVVLRWCCC